MRRIVEIFFLYLLFHSSVIRSQDLGIDSSQNIDAILNSRGEAYIGIPIQHHKSFLAELSELTPVKVTDSLIYSFVNREMYSQLLESGIEYRLLPTPSLIRPVKMASDIDEVLTGNAYPTYAQYLQLMAMFRDNYPNLCTIDTIGYSINGRLILSARLQRGNYIKAEKPLVFYSSSMHGNELTGYSLMLMLINDILKNSESNAQISGILNDLVVSINPLANPDGAYYTSDTTVYGAIRQNRNNYDLNRNFHDVTKGVSYTYQGLQKENLEMVKYMEKFPPNLSANFHGGAEVLNYPWDSWLISNKSHADNNWFIEISKDYVQSARQTDPNYLKLYPAGYVFGSTWYLIVGGRQDFVTYCLRGREMTIELSDDYIPHISQIPGFWTKNHQALLDLIEKARYGFHGTVVDSLTNKPLIARIEIPGYDKDNSFIYSNDETGRFFRYLPEGNYSLDFILEGYHTKTIDVQIEKKQNLDIEIAMVPIKHEISVRNTPGNNLEISLNDDSSETFTTELFELTGRKVQESIFIGNTGVIEGSRLHGIYILKIKTDVQSISRLVFFPIL